eukprot:1139846-Pelagomonas_calceolata.AAC.1
MSAPARSWTSRAQFSFPSHYFFLPASHEAPAPCIWCSLAFDLPLFGQPLTAVLENDTKLKPLLDVSDIGLWPSWAMTPLNNRATLAVPALPAGRHFAVGPTSLAAGNMMQTQRCHWAVAFSGSDLPGQPRYWIHTQPLAVSMEEPA